ncbi:Prenyltransferase family protein [Hibiscus syriacus]|uniref:Prenyltransferase family protein n=1 Tax=Hibiscus syriacus TaxID=106335 RepID=A0A6A3BB40_HIBSY|nr:Prenyltransferase family protein [Hibiscus syriacus]
MLAEEKAVKEFSYAVSGVLSSSDHFSTSRSENLKELIDGGEKYVIYKFNLRYKLPPSSCMFVDGNGGTREVDLENMEKCKANLLEPYSAKLIDGINQSEARRRGLTLFCFIYLNINARVAYMLSFDRKGFDVLGKVRGKAPEDEENEYHWKQFRIPFKEEAREVESFCLQLVEMEEEAIKMVYCYSGLG